MNTRTFALVFGIIFLLVGVGGFIPGLTTAASPDPGLSVVHGYGHELGLFPVNTLHNIVHLIFGVWGLAASRALGAGRAYAKGVAIIYALFTVMGLVPGLHTTFGLVPLYGADVILHLLLAAIAGYFGFVRNDAVITDRA
ncbi:DUF4383 domain-containing protein [Sphingosinicella sp. BN140058]|uniref:DUF4383 domain-containing protein n=1 Tax=Sphingosinicella sp. BN140058 TaxID=1892855 RepID=UPI0010129414|nr:DUF4383 domain-containing protein [Sphingosinicella sp. BN140058]QAY75965.1 DUF4383 domain-containing protein [Sphingosinicella sp. BN140058]